jgi:hypothetical protein
LNDIRPATIAGIRASKHGNTPAKLGREYYKVAGSFHTISFRKLRRI